MSVVLVGAVLATGGCSGEGDPPAGEPDRRTEAQLTRALLKDGDLPGRFAPIPPDADAVGSGFEDVCQEPVPGDPDLLVGRGFAAGVSGTIGVTSVIAQYPTVAEAREVFEAIRTGWGECSDSDYDGLSFAMRPKDAPRVGEEAFGVKVELVSDIIAQTVQMYALSGSTVVEASAFGTYPDADFASEALRTVMQRLRTS